MIIIDLANFISVPRFRQRLIDKIKEGLRTDGNDVELLRYRALRRLKSALENCEITNAGEACDEVALIRQYLNYFDRGRGILPAAFCAKHLKSFEKCDINVSSPNAEGLCRVKVTPWNVAWLDKNAMALDRWQGYKKPDIKIEGDGFLRQASSGTLNAYKSLSQRVALHAAMSMPNGGSLLAILPTGEGKSLIGISGAVSRARAGSEQCGTTLVIVPTVSLAIDQQEQTKQFFLGMGGSKLPRCYLGCTGAAEKREIREGIINGTIPVVYTSPESVVRGGLRSAVEKAASAGALHTIVFDEVHMLESWGETFRPEFVWLASLRKDLVKASGNKMTTILLSATISKKCQSMLRDVFSDENGELCVVDGKVLRSEPEFWGVVEKSREERIAHMQDLLFHVPRPILIYSTLVREAKSWYDMIKSWGFNRVGLYTGETFGDERARLVDKWKNDDLDIMVATSAFGLGIDKQDVRCIVHACLPEGVDRFYQEVGRGGRDGFASLSILMPIKSNGREQADWEIASRLASGKTLNAMLMPRWDALWKRRMHNPDGSYNLDLDALHQDLLESCDENRKWNKSLLGSLVRSKIIELVPPYLDDAEYEEAAEKREKLIGVRVLSEKVIKDKKILEEKLRRQRAVEVDSKRKDFKLICEIAENRYDCCIGHIFMSAYNMSYGLACGGCRVCRKSSGSDIQQESDAPWPIVENKWRFSGQANIGQTVKDLMDPYREMALSYDAQNRLSQNDDVCQVVNFLANSGFQQFIVESRRFNFIKNTLSSSQKVWGLLKHEYFTQDTNIIFNIPTVIIYENYFPGNMEKIYLQQKIQLDKDVYRIHIIPSKFKLPIDGTRCLTEVLACNAYHVKTLIKRI